MQDAYIFDCDGTLALHEGVRSPYDETKVKYDNPNMPVIRMAQILSEAGYAIVIVSGRHESARVDTARWLIQNDVPVDALYMRPDSSRKDQEKDADLKERIYNEHIRENYNVLGVYDDRNRVVERWRELGLTCFQVAEGNF